MGGVRRGDLRGGPGRLSREADREQRVPDPGRTARLLGSALREGRPRASALARGPARVHSLPTMRVLVTGGAGFIGSHFAKRLVAAGDDVVVLDKLTYSGNPANLEGCDCRLVVGDICDPEAVAEAGAGRDANVNFAAETHVDRSILGATEFVQTDVLGT